MLASMNPLGERSRRTRFAVTVTFYVAGSLAGGALAGALLGLLGDGLRAVVPLRPATTAVLVVLVAAAGLALDLGVGSATLPTLRRQVDEDWLTRYRGWVYGLGFGFQLGVGVVTIVTTAAAYLLWVLALLAGSLSGGAVIGVTFGLVRALPVVALARADDPGRLRHALRRASGWARPAHVGSLGVSGAVAVVGLIALVGTVA